MTEPRLTFTQQCKKPFGRTCVPYSITYSRTLASYLLNVVALYAHFGFGKLPATPCSAMVSQPAHNIETAGSRANKTNSTVTAAVEVSHQYATALSNTLGGLVLRPHSLCRFFIGVLTPFSTTCYLEHDIVIAVSN